MNSAIELLALAPSGAGAGHPRRSPLLVADILCRWGSRASPLRLTPPDPRTWHSHFKDERSRAARGRELFTATFVIRQRQRLILDPELAATPFLLLRLDLQSTGDTEAPAGGTCWAAPIPPRLLGDPGKAVLVSSLPRLPDVVTHGSSVSFQFLRILGLCLFLGEISRVLPCFERHVLPYQDLSFQTHSFCSPCLALSHSC